MATDLSLKHEPITDLFPRAASAEDWDRYRLSDEQVAQFHRDGFLPRVRILDERQIE